MHMKILHNPRCRKSREALAMLEDTGKHPQVVEYLKTPPTKSELKDILRKLGIPALDLIRKGETLYKEKYKGRQHTEEEWIEIMAANPILIERPVVISGDKAVLARPPEKVKAIL